MTDTELAENIERLKAAKEKIWKKLLTEYNEPCPTRYIFIGQIQGIDASLNLLGAKK